MTLLERLDIMSSLTKNPHWPNIGLDSEQQRILIDELVGLCGEAAEHIRGSNFEVAARRYKNDWIYGRLDDRDTF